MALQDQYLVPTTTLQAVNAILRACNQREVNSLDSADTNVMTQQALQRLYEASREMQAEGWHWNMLLDYSITPNDDGELLLPAGTLEVKEVYYPGFERVDLHQDGAKLYDRLNHTFTPDLTSVKVDLTILKEFERLPEAARWYVTCKAARRMAPTHLASGTVAQITQSDEQQARLRLEQTDAETDLRTLWNNPHFRRMRRR